MPEAFAGFLAGSQVALWRPIPFRVCERLPVGLLPLAASAPSRPAEGQERQTESPGVARSALLPALVFRLVFGPWGNYLCRLRRCVPLEG